MRLSSRSPLGAGTRCSKGVSSVGCMCPLIVRRLQGLGACRWVGLPSFHPLPPGWPQDPVARIVGVLLDGTGTSFPFRTRLALAGTPCWVWQGSICFGGVLARMHSLGGGRSGECWGGAGGANQTHGVCPYW